MKRKWIAAGALASVLIGAAVVANAQGAGWSGRQGRGVGSADVSAGQRLQLRDGTCFDLNGEPAGERVGAQGGQAKGNRRGGQGGRGMMGAQGMMGAHGMMASDPTALAARTESMLEHHETMLSNLEERLAAASDEQVQQTLASRIERQKIMIDWQQGRLDVLKEAPQDSTAAHLALVQYDVEYFEQATATDPDVQTWIANRLDAAKQRLAALKASTESGSE